MQVEQKLQEGIITGVERTLEQRENLLLQALPQMIEDAISTVMKRQEIGAASIDAIYGVDCGESEMIDEEQTKKALQEKKSELPEVTDELPMEAFDFLG